MAKKSNPPSQRQMAKALACSRGCVRYNLKKLGFKMYKKPRCHFLPRGCVEKRRRRSWPLYKRILKAGWSKFVTSDEAWFYLSDCGRLRNVQYVSRFRTRAELEPKLRHSHPKGVMVWAAISANGVSKPIFIEPGAKIDAQYYVRNVLEPFFKRDLPRLYPKKDCFSPRFLPFPRCYLYPKLYEATGN